MITGIPVLIGGEKSISDRKLKELVKKLSKDYQAEFLASVQPEMSENGYLPSMTKASLKPQLQLFNMKVLRCEPKGTNGSVGQLFEGTRSEQEVANCFIASKSLNLTEPTFLDMNEITRREIRMPSLRTYKPVQSLMEIPVRPPTHSGG
ncbi:uncharacterized protein LOC123551995 [Mercenaria mercenaria]|uniref:uncharacterized protein LOC123551995 n=1 Tax=Mercenaria mercenaria TaxID=6596 RepID=UPI00234F7282|nr:uncharacterized protein LOC123551995 [Mercenaria mercenaria]